MNKLLVSDIIKLNSGSYILSCQYNSLEIIIDGIVTIYLINENLNNIKIKLEDNSELKVYKFNKLSQNNTVIDIIQNNNSKIYYNEAYLNENNNNLTINNYLKGNNNESNINVRNISNNGESKIIINVMVDKNTINNIAIEDLKGINNGGNIHIEPNIICDSNEVIANHLTTIGNIDKDSLNYLMSKGLSERLAEYLILQGFIYSNMDEYIKDLLEVK